MKRGIKELAIWLNRQFVVKLEQKNIGMESLFTSKQHLNLQILCGRTSIGQPGLRYSESSLHS